MYEIIVKGFKTKEQAEGFIDWYEGSGEQHVEGWVDVSMNTDMSETFPLKWNGNQVSLVLDIEDEE